MKSWKTNHLDSKSLGVPQGTPKIRENKQKPKIWNFSFRTNLDFYQKDKSLDSDFPGSKIG